MSERAILLTLAMLAALRVGFYATAFPFTSNVDEPQHYDVVVRWSLGRPPHAIGRLDPSTASELGLIASREFYARPSDAEPGPPTRMTEPERSASVSARARRAAALENHEMLQPPLYYAAAGAWRAVWRALGIPEGPLAYAVRLLNVFICFGTVLVGGAFARRAFPLERFGRLGVPALIAFLPQDAFYSISNDVPAALLVGGSLVLLLDFAGPRGASILRAAAAGLLAAAAILCKLPNIVILVPLIGAATVSALRARRADWPRRDVLGLTTLGLTTLLPLTFWMLHNLLVIGDLTGGGATARASGWTLKPVSTMLDHPLMSPATAAGFLAEITRTLWRGEFIWYGARLALPWVDTLYVAATAFALAGALCATLQCLRRGPSIQAYALIGSWVTLCAGVGFLAAQSMAWDFGSWFYPSRAKPILASGRLVLSGLIPMATLFVAGLGAWARLVRAPWARWPLLLMLLAVATASEALLSAPVFGSPWNAYHLFGP